MKLNFNFQLKNITGQEYQSENDNASLVLSNIVGSSVVKGGSLLLNSWAKTLYKKEELELNKEESTALINLIENSELYPVIIKAQLIELIK